MEKAHFTIACDVQNPFCGPNGAAYVYAPQKGATPEMVQTLDKGMRTFAKVIHTTTGYDITNLPGAGAAGGLGGLCLNSFSIPSPKSFPLRSRL